MLITLTHDHEFFDNLLKTAKKNSELNKDKLNLVYKRQSFFSLALS